MIIITTNDLTRMVKCYTTSEFRHALSGLNLKTHCLLIPDLYGGYPKAIPLGTRNPESNIHRFKEYLK